MWGQRMGRGRGGEGSGRLVPYLVVGSVCEGGRQDASGAEWKWKNLRFVQRSAAWALTIELTIVD